MNKKNIEQIFKNCDSNLCKLNNDIIRETERYPFYNDAKNRKEEMMLSDKEQLFFLLGKQEMIIETHYILKQLLEQLLKQ